MKKTNKLDTGRTGMGQVNPRNKAAGTGTQVGAGEPRQGKVQGKSRRTGLRNSTGVSGPGNRVAGRQGNVCTRVKERDR